MLLKNYQLFHFIYHQPLPTPPFISISNKKFIPTLLPPQHTTYPSNTPATTTRCKPTLQLKIVASDLLLHTNLTPAHTTSLPPHSEVFYFWSETEKIKNRTTGGSYFLSETKKGTDDRPLITLSRSDRSSNKSQYKLFNNYLSQVS